MGGSDPDGPQPSARVKGHKRSASGTQGFGYDPAEVYRLCRGGRFHPVTFSATWMIRCGG